MSILLIDDSAPVRSRAAVTRIVLVTILVLFTQFDSAGWACSCSAITPQVAVERADVIFRGRVTSVDRGYLRCMWAGVRYAIGSIFGGGSDRDVESGCEVRASFELVAVWKGSL